MHISNRNGSSICYNSDRCICILFTFLTFANIYLAHTCLTSASTWSWVWIKILMQQTRQRACWLKSKELCSLQAETCCLFCAQAVYKQIQYQVPQAGWQNPEQLISPSLELVYIFQRQELFKECTLDPHAPHKWKEHVWILLLPDLKTDVVTQDTHAQWVMLKCKST